MLRFHEYSNTVVNVSGISGFNEFSSLLLINIANIL